MTTTDTRAIRDLKSKRSKCADVGNLELSNVPESHEIIWLQWGDNGGDDDTWAQNNINDEDIPYVRADLAFSLCDALDAAQAENKRLQTIIGNLHVVEKQHRETANTHFHRANRLQVENERLRNFIVDFSETKFDRIDRRSPDPQDDLDPLTDYLAIEAWQEDARAALAQEGGE